MDEKDKLELIQGLIVRSDSLRASYSNRAALVLSADALILATAAFLLDKVQSAHPYKITIIILVVLSLLLMFISFELALRASTSFAESSSEAGLNKGVRYFFNSTDTLRKFGELDRLKEAMQSPKYQELIECGCAELWVGYVLQRNRHHKLKSSMKALRVAVLLLIVAVCIAFLNP